jgi:hypothetical protein
MLIVNIDYYILNHKIIKFNNRIIKQNKLIHNKPNCLLFTIGYNLKYKYPYDYYDKFVYHIKFNKNIFTKLNEKKRRNNQILFIDCNTKDIDDLIEKYGDKLDWKSLIERYSGIYFKNYNSELDYNRYKWYEMIEFDKGYIWDKSCIDVGNLIINPHYY